MKCIVCHDELDDFCHKDADLLECWKSINDVTHFMGNPKPENLKVWLAGPILGQEKMSCKLCGDPVDEHTLVSAIACLYDLDIDPKAYLEKINIDPVPPQHHYNIDAIRKALGTYRFE